MKITYLTIIHDVWGAPRAYGVASNAAASQAEAERQWRLRVEQRTRDGTLDVSEQRGETTTEPLRCDWIGYVRDAAGRYAVRAEDGSIVAAEPLFATAIEGVPADEVPDAVIVALGPQYAETCRRAGFEPAACGVALGALDDEGA